MGDSSINRLDYQRRRLYHARLSAQLHDLDWELLAANIDRVALAVSGDMATAALGEWRRLVAERDQDGIRRVLAEDSDEADLMRIVSPFAGVLSESARLAVIEQVPRDE